MIRRIASACLALLILISALPLGAAAVEIGDTVWLPAGENPGAGWEPKVDDWMKNGCDLEGHVHDQSCVSDNYLVCTVEPGTHVHDQNCGYYDTRYQWVYTGNATGGPVGTPATLTVRNMDPDGNPVAGTEFFLYEEKGSAMIQIGETVTTDAEGKATFGNLALPANVDEATWFVAQKSLGEAEENYRPNNAKYKVKIVRNEDNTHTVSVEQAESFSVSVSKKVKAAAAAAAEEGNTTIFINELVAGMILINMEFVGDVIPMDSYQVTLTGPSGFKKEITFSSDMDGYYWQALVETPGTGTYKIQMDEAAAKAEGYALTTTYTAQQFRPNSSGMPDSSKGKTLELTNRYTAGSMTITNQYKMEMPKTVVLKAMDTLGNPLGGAGYGAFYGSTDLSKLGDEPVLDTDGDGEQIIPVNDYLAEAKRFLEEGVPETVNLKQTTAPEGYELSQTVYPLTVTKVNGEIEYVIEGEGAEMKDGVMTLPFVHEAKLGTLSVKLETQDTIPASVTEFPVIITKDGKIWNMTFPTHGGERTLELPMGTYTVMLATEAVKAPGYDLLAPVYSSQTVTFAKDGATAECVITVGYERIKDPKNRILVKAVDSETEEILSGAEFVLADNRGNEIELTKSNADGSYLVENLEDLAVDGETVTCTLYQSEAPFGYHDSADRYLVDIVESNGTVTVKEPRRDAGFFSRLMRSGVEKESEYGQTAVFENEAILVDLNVGMSLDINFGALPLEKIPVTITGKNVEESFELGNGETYCLKNIRLGEYTINQQAEVEGYTLTTEYDVSRGTVTGNKLTLASADTLWICNSYDNSAGELHVAASTSSVPEALDTLPVEVTDAAGNVTSMTIARGRYEFEGYLELAPGTYTVAIAENDILLEGYVLDSSTVTPKTVTVNAKHWTNCEFYPEFKAASAEAPKTVQFSLRDQFDRAVPGATVSISWEGGSLEITDNGELDLNKDDAVISVDLTDTMNKLLEGMGENSHVTLWLKQTGAPEGYATSTAMTPITLEKVGKNFQCSVGGQATTTSDQVFVRMENKVLNLGTLRLKLNLTGEIPQSIIDYYDFSTGVVEKNGDSYNFWLSSGGGGIKERALPLGEYTISMNDWVAQVTGYDHDVTFSPETVTLSENGQVEECVITIQYTKQGAPKGTLNLSLNFGETAPEGLDSVTIIAKEAGGKTTSIPVSAAKQWKTTMELPEGTYTFDVQPVEGYTVTLVDENIKAPVAKDVPANVTVSLTAEKVAEEPVQVEFDKIILWMKDTKGNALPGAKVSAYVVIEDLEIPVIQDVEDGGAQDADKTKDGKLELDGIAAKIEKYKSKLSEGENVLKLKQTKAPEGYEVPSDTVITVTVTKTGEDLQYFVAGADVQNRVMNLTMNHPVKTGLVNLEVKMKGSSVPTSVTEIKVIATDTESGDVHETLVTKAAGWKLSWNLPLGTYNISQDPDSVAAEGYTLHSNPVPATVTVVEGEDGVACTITNTYSKKASSDPTKPTTKPTDPDETDPTKPTTKPTTKPSTEEDVDVAPTGKLIIRTVDEKGSLWGGAKYGLFYGSNEIRSFTDYGTGTINIDDPDLVMGIYTNAMIATGAPLTLKQTRAPGNADGLSQKLYTVRVMQQEDKVMLEVEGAEVNDEGTQIAEFSNRHPVTAETAPADPDSSTTIVIRTMDDAGNALTGAEYCMSADQYFDKDEDTVYSEADRNGEIIIKDLHKYLGSAKSATYYLMQSRQPDNSKLSTDTFKVELGWKNGRLDVKVKKDEGLFDTKSNGNVEEGTDGEWIVNFVSKQKMTAIQVNYTETVNWNNALKVEDMLQGLMQEEYEFQLKWDYLGEPQEPLTLKLRGGESGTFEPIPNGARYQLVLPEGAFKAVAKQEDLMGRAAADNVSVDVEMIYNIVPGAPLMIDMVRIDAETEKPLAGAAYTLKDEDGEEVDTYKTRSDGQFVVDAITEPGEYTLTETAAPEGYSKVKKPITLNVALKLEPSTDANGDPVILQKLEADVNHSMVKQLPSGSYRIGSAQSDGSGSGLIIAGAVAAAAGAAGAGALLLSKRKRKRAF